MKAEVERVITQLRSELHYVRYVHFVEARSHLVREVGCYERHHIVPLALGGSNSRSNIVRLTPREHFVAHRLLYKAHGGKMTYAFNSFVITKKGKISSRTYEKLAAERSLLISVAHKGMTHTPEAKQKMSEVKKKQYAESVTSGTRGMKHSEEARHNVSLSLLGRVHTEETKAKIGKANSASRLGRTFSAKTREKMSKAHKENARKADYIHPSKGKSMSIESRRRMSDAAKKRYESAKMRDQPS